MIWIPGGADSDLVPGGRGCSPCQAPTGSCSNSSATTPATKSQHVMSSLERVYLKSNFNWWNNFKLSPPGKRHCRLPGVSENQGIMRKYLSQNVDKFTNAMFIIFSP